MTQIIEVPGYGEVEFPDNMSDAQISQAIQQNIIKETPQQSGALQNLIQGGLASAADVSSTLMYPVNKLLYETGLSELSPSQRRLGVQELVTKGADKKGFPFAAGRLTGDIALTAPIFGGAGAAAKSVPALARFAPALRTGGLSLGGAQTGSTAANLATRAGAGALTGGAAAGLINPEQAATGAALGAALPVAAQGVVAGGRGLANLVGGIGTYTGGEPIKQAARAGYIGGDLAKTFTDNLRKNVPVDDVLEAARYNIQKIGQAKNAAYRSGMANVAKDKSILSFNMVDKSLDDAFKMATYKGQAKGESAVKAQQQLASKINEWKQLDPVEFHTPEGFDALKQAIGDIRDSIPYNEKTARAIANNVYNTIKSDISKQAPTYSKVMKDYSQASELLNEIQRELVGGNKATAAQSMRKLQSVMRNNVSAAFGRRAELAQELERQGGREIMPALAGQALSTWTPRSLGAIPGSLAAGYATFINPLALPALAAQSPRIVGEAAYLSGVGSRGLSNAMKAYPPAGLLGAYMNEEQQ